MANSRVARGRKSQDILAQYLRANGWPMAQPIAASLPGKDILGVEPLAIEVKATEVANLPGAVRQARTNAIGGELPLVVYRPRGYGPERVEQWLVIFDLETAVRLLREGSYCVEG